MQCQCCESTPFLAFHLVEGERQRNNTRTHTHKKSTYKKNDFLRRNMDKFDAILSQHSASSHCVVLNGKCLSFSLRSFQYSG